MAYFNNLTVGGTAKFLQDVKWPGLKSTVDELNYLHTEIIAKDGWYFPDKGEFILDYSAYDAKKAGFNKVVFVIKEEMLDIFKHYLQRHYKDWDESKLKYDKWSFLKEV